MARFLIKEDVERWLELRAEGLEKLANEGWASYAEVRAVKQVLDVLKTENMNKELAYLEARMSVREIPEKHEATDSE